MEDDLNHLASFSCVYGAWMDPHIPPSLEPWQNWGSVHLRDLSWTRVFYTFAKTSIDWVVANTLISIFFFNFPDMILWIFVLIGATVLPGNFWDSSFSSFPLGISLFNIRDDSIFRKNIVFWIHPFDSFHLWCIFLRFCNIHVTLWYVFWIFSKRPLLKITQSEVV